MSAKSETITFRLPTALFRRLERAGTEAGTSVHEEARRRVIASLRSDDQKAQEQEDRTEIRIRFDELERDLTDIKRDLATAVHALLLAVTQPGKKATPQEIEKWVKESLKCASSQRD